MVRPNQIKRKEQKKLTLISEEKEVKKWNKDMR